MKILKYYFGRSLILADDGRYIIYEKYTDKYWIYADFESADKDFMMYVEKIVNKDQSLRTLFFFYVGLITYIIQVLLNVFLNHIGRKSYEENPCKHKGSHECYIFRYVIISMSSSAFIRQLRRLVLE